MVSDPEFDVPEAIALGKMRTALGVPTFYNEALGSVSQVSVYDRVKGRPGDAPDKTVGAHSEDGGH